MTDTTSQEQQTLAQHTRLLCESYRHWTGMRLIESDPDTPEGVEELMNAPFAVASHDSMEDPVFNYANNAALQLFGMERDEIIGLPSRFSAEPAGQGERTDLLERVTQHGFVDDYSGVRIAKSGLRFLIRNAVVWNVLDEQGTYKGQAALIRDWTPV
jgi:PAS domain-containing protein